MNLKNFKAGTYKKQKDYESFYPAKINHSWVWDDPKVNVLLETATKALGQLEGFTNIVPDVDLFIRMHILKEANKSSRIEGTQTEIDEDLMRREDIVPEKREDWQEVQQYVEAMNHSIEQLANLPLSNWLLKEAHRILLQGVRGEHKRPGEFRISQNWIGGSSISDAAFVPPIHQEVPDLMSDLEKFWHNKNIDVPDLIKVAISHYQFETVHPFLDGNGRIGRLFITLYLVDRKLLSRPSLYLSDFFERNRGAYYDALTRVRESNDMIHWIKFFLNAVIETAGKSLETFNNILTLKNDIDAKIVTLNRKAENGRKLVHKLYSNPVTHANEVVNITGLGKKAAIDLIKAFEKIGILEEITGYKRNRVYLFKKYVGLF